jgi:1-deoxy-D-xylulose-5-phosphate reductoisomerase
MTWPTVYSAADEVAVHAFARDAIDFLGIPRLIEQVLARHDAHPVASLDDVLEADRWARTEAQRLLHAAR